MAGVVGIRFARAGKIQYFDPGDEELGLSDYVVVESERGEELGYVAIAPDQVIMSKFKSAPPPIVRRASPEDVQARDRLVDDANNALLESKSLVRELGLDMKPVDARFNLDGSQLTINYTSDDRVDFRNLLKRLGRNLQTRVELRQIGPRDATKSLGGMGRCGRELCCSTWLVEFQPVTMRMAKEQDLPLSPPGLAGVCGRLRCCLRYEYEQYRELKRGLPKIGSKIDTPQGAATVVVGHPLKQTITVRLESGAWTELAMADLETAANS